MPYVPFGSSSLEYSPAPRRFDEVFDELRKTWRRLDRTQLVWSLIQRLHQKESVDAITFALDARARGHMDFVPRSLLLWVLADTHVYRGTLKAADETTIRRMLNLTWELSAARGALRPFDESPFLALRNIAVQQFSQQELLLKSTVGRNWIIFGSLASNHRVRKLLEDVVGVSVEDAMAFVFLLSSACIRPSGTSLRQVIFRYARDVFNVKTLLRDTLCAHDGSALRNSIRVAYTQEEVFAPSPFIRYPLVQLSGEVCIVDPICAAKTAEHFPAQIVAEFGTQEHKKALTELYEAYANQRVSEVFPDDSIVGETLRALVRGRVCDQFIRLSPTKVLLVEVKSGALPDHKSVSMSGDRLFRTLEGILKEGFEQLLAAQRQLLAQREIQPSDQVVMLLVTRENLRLPSGVTLRGMMPKLETHIVSIGGDKTWDDLFVCCLDEFDELLDLHATNAVRLADFFSDVSVTDANHVRSKMGLGGRLRSAKLAHVAPHLHAAYSAAATHCGLLLSEMFETR